MPSPVTELKKLSFETIGELDLGKVSERIRGVVEKARWAWAPLVAAWRTKLRVVRIIVVWRRDGPCGRYKVTARSFAHNGQRDRSLYRMP